MTLKTVLTIQGRDVRCGAGGPCTEGEPNEIGKYCGWIMLDVERWHPLVNTNPIYDTEKEAEEKMEALVAEVRALDMTKHKENLMKVIGPAAPLVMDIVAAAQK